MYDWYKKAKVCYAYLWDVESSVSLMPRQEHKLERKNHNGKPFASGLGFNDSV